MVINMPPCGGVNCEVKDILISIVCQGVDNISLYLLHVNGVIKSFRRY